MQKRPTRPRQTRPMRPRRPASWVPRGRPKQSRTTRAGLNALGMAKIAGNGASRARRKSPGLLVLAGLGAGAAALKKRRRQQSEVEAPQAAPVGAEAVETAAPPPAAAPTA